MTIECPCCGQPINLDNPPENLLRFVHATKSERRVLDALIDAYPRPVTLSLLIDACYWDDPNGGPSNAGNVIKQYICRLRRKLPKYGWRIPKYGPGNQGKYQLEPTNA